MWKFIVLLLVLVTGCAGNVGTAPAPGEVESAGIEWNAPECSGEKLVTTSAAIESITDCAKRTALIFPGYDGNSFCCPAAAPVPGDSNYGR